MTWQSVTPSIAGTPHVRISRDGGRTYPARHARPLPAGPPGQPCTVPVYDPGAGTGRMLALDLDPACGRGAADPAAQVSAQADAIARLVACHGGRCVTDVAPGGGRHVYVLFAAPLPWRELRDLARAMALRFPTVDLAPMSSLGGQISPPGSRHKSGGWRALTSPLQEARAAAGRPNGPEVWSGLLAEFAAELRLVAPVVPCGDVPERAELDDAGVPRVPRLGGRAALDAELEQAARTGRWDRTRYAGRSEVRMAILSAAVARGWRLADVQAAIGSGAWRGLAQLYSRASEPGRLARLLPLEWQRAVVYAGGGTPIGFAIRPWTRRRADQSVARLSAFSTRGLTDLAAMIAGHKRPALGAEWRAHLVGESGHDQVTWQKVKEALGFVVFAIRCRCSDAADAAWTLVDAILRSRRLSNLLVFGPTAMAALFILRRLGTLGLLTSAEGISAIGGGLYALVRVGRWWRDVKPPEPKARRVKE